MKDSPAYHAAHVALYQLIRHAGLPDTVAVLMADGVLSQLAEICERHPDRAERVIVWDNRTRLAAENPALHEAGERG